MAMKGKHSKTSRLPRWPLALALVALIGAAALLWTLRSSEEAKPASAPVPPDEIEASEPEIPPEPEPDPIPEPEPEPEPAPLEALLSGMTLREKICQLFIVFPQAITNGACVTEAGAEMEKGLADFPVGGLLLNRNNLASQEQVRAMLDEAQGYSTIPLLATCDEEGGRVNRLMKTVGTTWVGPMLDYKDQGPETAEANARTIASDLVSCGFNMDFAPVADVWSNPENTVIGDRAYSDDFQQAAELVAAAVEGFHEGGTACTLKHFPGHGDTSADSHYGSVYVHKTLDELRQAELLPFQAGIDAGADAVMIGHLIVDQLDSQPALFSYTVVTELLRGELEFNGVVVTDSLEMQAMTDHYGSGEIAVSAVQAGVDILLCPTDLEESIAALTQAVTDGRITEQRLNESVLRILRLKQNHGLLANLISG